MYKNLLVPTDGSELSTEAARKAIALAKALDAKITFLYVQPDFPLPIVGEGALIAPESRDEFSKSTREQADHILREACEYGGGRLRHGNSSHRRQRRTV